MHQLMWTCSVMWRWVFLLLLGCYWMTELIKLSLSLLAQYVSWWQRWRPATDVWGRSRRPSNGRIWSWQLQPAVDTSVRPAARHNCFWCCWWCKTTWVCPSPDSSHRSIAGQLVLHSIRTFCQVFDFCKFVL